MGEIGQPDAQWVGVLDVRAASVKVRRQSHRRSCHQQKLLRNIAAPPRPMFRSVRPALLSNIPKG